MPFQPGQSGNPSGRPKHTMQDGRTIADVAREHTVGAVETLAMIMRDDKQAGAARVSAAIAILDRAWGRPKQTIETESNFDLAAAIAAGRRRVLEAG